MSILRCPNCSAEEIFAQQKAFVTQGVQLRDDGSLDYEVWTSEDVDFEGPEWFTCRECGEHAETIGHFVVER